MAVPMFGGLTDRAVMQQSALRFVMSSRCPVASRSAESLTMGNDPAVVVGSTNSEADARQAANVREVTQRLAAVCQAEWVPGGQFPDFLSSGPQ